MKGDVQPNAPSILLVSMRDRREKTIVKRRRRELLDRDESRRVSGGKKRKRTRDYRARNEKGIVGHWSHRRTLITALE